MIEETSHGEHDTELLTIHEVAAIVRAPVATLRYWRHLGTGPRSFRVGDALDHARAEAARTAAAVANARNPVAKVLPNAEVVDLATYKARPKTAGTPANNDGAPGRTPSGAGRPPPRILNAGGVARKAVVLMMRPRQDSNLRSRLRRAVLYPLSYGGLSTARGRPASGQVRCEPTPRHYGEGRAQSAGRR